MIPLVFEAIGSLEYEICFVRGISALFWVKDLSLPHNHLVILPTTFNSSFKSLLTSTSSILVSSPSMMVVALLTTGPTPALLSVSLIPVVPPIRLTILEASPHSLQTDHNRRPLMLLDAFTLQLESLGSNQCISKVIEQDSAWLAAIW